MRFKLTVFFFFSILFLNNCEKKESDISQNEYAIYNAFFDSVTESDEIEIDSISIAILDSTSIRKDLSLSDERITKLQDEWGIELSKELIDDFKTKNTLKHFVQDYFETKLKYQIIATDDYLEIFDDSSPWLKLKEKYPEAKSYLKFSRAGLNTQKDKALLFVSINCGPLCGTTWFIYLEKVDNKWELTNEQMLTIS